MKEELHLKEETKRLIILKKLIKEGMCSIRINDFDPKKHLKLLKINRK